LSNRSIEDFEKKVSRATEITIRAREKERLRLIELAKNLIQIRIDESDQDRHRQSARQLSDLIFEGKLPQISFPDDYRNKLKKKYEDILPDIHGMPTEELFQLIMRLKDSKKLLINILKSVPKVPISTRYVANEK
jgi:hypothetical protein